MALSFGGGGSSAGSHKNMVEFRAGKMNLKGNTCTPDKRKGLVYIYHSEDGLTHFCWKDRKTGTVEDDLIIFPDDCEFKKVTQCKAGSRVYLLKFKASARKLFFWIQEPVKKKTSTASTPDDSKDNKDSKTEDAIINETDAIDEDILWKVNSALNNPQQLIAEQSRDSKRSSSKSTGNSKSAALNNFLSGAGAPSEADMQALLSNMSQSQLMQLIGGMNDMGGPTALLQQLTGGGSGGSSEESTPVSSENNSRHRSRHPPSTNSTTTAQPSSTLPSVPSSSSDDSVKIQLSDLQKILSNMGGGSGNQESPVDLSYGVNSDLIKRLIAGSSSEALSKIAQLLPQFNAEIDTKKENISSASGKAPAAIRSEIEETLSSPQFTSALGSFCAAFPSGQLGPLISQFNMGPESVVAAQNGDFEGFLSSIQKEVELKDNQQAVESLSSAATPPQNGNQKGNNSMMEVDENSTSEQGKAQKSTTQQETPKKDKGKAEKNENKDDMHTD